MTRWRLWLPLALFVGVVAIVAIGLYRPADRTVASAMIGKPLPDFALKPIVPGKPGVSSAAFRQGTPRLLNVFASWCVPCIAEAPRLMRLKAAGVSIEAVAVRDTAPAIRDFLSRNGDPYVAIGDDPASSVQLSIGSSGVPETFVVNGRGIIVKQHIGDIRDDDVPGILAALEAAK